MEVLECDRVAETLEAQYKAKMSWVSGHYPLVLAWLCNPHPSATRKETHHLPHLQVSGGIALGSTGLAL